MMDAFAKQLNDLPSYTKLKWNPKTRRIRYVLLCKSWNTFCHHNQLPRCLAHIINLATQAVISTYSKTKHFDPVHPSEHEPDTEAFVRDEIGLVRAITVKVSSLIFLLTLANGLAEGSFLCKLKAAFQEYPSAWRH
jgi:hypothetical protein